MAPNGRDAGELQSTRQREEAEQSRIEAERKLAEIQRKREELSRTPVAPNEAPAAEEKRKKELAKLESDKAEIEREMREAIARATVAQRETPKTEEKPLTPLEAPGVKQERKTQAVIAQIEEAQGDAFVMAKEGKVPAKPGSDVLPGQAFETGGGASRIVLRFPDKTRVEFGPETMVTEVQVESGKRLVVTKGTVRAEVSKQPKDQPFIFATPHGEAKVVGTTLRLYVDPDPKKGTRLEVEEGKVELKNLAEKTVLVESGHYAVTAAGVDLASRPLPIEDVLLVPTPDEHRVKKVGGEWRLVKDENAVAGTAFEVPLEFQRGTKLGTPSLDLIASHLVFTFTADGDKDYFLWIRGQCMATSNRSIRDAIVVQVPGARITKPAYANVDLAQGPDRAPYNGYGFRMGYWWVGGDADFFDAQGKMISWSQVVNERHGDETPTVLRFAKSGPQVLRIFAQEAPIRIDAVWLSTTQKTRPDPQQRGPLSGLR